MWTTIPAATLAELLFDKAAVGLCLVSPSGIVLRCNPEWLRAIGLGAEQVVGKEIVALFPGGRDGAERYARARAGARVQVPRHARRVEGRETWWEGDIEAVPMEHETGLLVTVREVSHAVEVERVADALRESEAKFRALADSIPQLAWTANPDGYITWYNRRWYEYTGETPAQTEGWGWERVHAPKMLPAVLDRWRASIATATAFEMEFPLRRADGTFRRFLTRVFPLKDDHGDVVQWFGTSTDVTELVEAQEALRESDRRKDEFLGMLSHELRNPLAPIRNSAYLLRHADAGTEQARRALAIIERQTEHLTRMVDDLLDVTRIGRGKIRLVLERLDLREVVRRTAEDFRRRIEEKGVTLRVVVPGVSVWADADPTRLTQLVGNLLHNAAKFTRAGDAVLLSLGTAGGRAEIRVRDTGAGIAPPLLPTLFAPFVQGDRTLARSEGGLGLGLALVKGIAELHGGSAEARSEGTGKGAEFVARLPLAPAPAAHAGDDPAVAATATGRRVLVVEDNVDGAQSLADVIRMLGHSVEITYDGPSALERARAHPPNVVICDIGLPGMSGYEVAQQLRAAAADGLQLIAITGFAQAEDVKRAVEAGFDAHVAKPCDPDELRRLLG